MSANTARDKCTGEDTLVLGVLRGFRAWDLEIWSNPLIHGQADTTSPDFLGLFATSISVPWTQPMKAQCLRTAGCPCESCAVARSLHIPTHDPAEGPIPVTSCECGIYGWYHPEWIVEDHWWPKSGAVGVIEASGKVVLGSRGFRAEQARTVALAPACNPDAMHGNVLPFLAAFDRILPRLLGHGVKVFDDVDALYAEYPPEDLSSLVDVEEPGGKI